MRSQGYEFMMKFVTAYKAIILQYVPDEWLRDFLKVCKSNNYKGIEEYVENFMCEGYAVSQFMIQFNEYFLDYDGYNEEKKAKIFKKLGVSYDITINTT